MATPTDDRARLLELVRLRSYREGDFVLSSGKKSSYYFDGKAVLLDGEAARLIARVILGEMARLGIDAVAVGGMELGAVPLACFVSALAPKPLGVFIVRKQAKDHGTGKRIEGPIGRGDSVIVLEDVVTTGAATLGAIAAVEAAGATVAGIFALVDREEDPLPELARYRDRFHPIFTIGDFRSKA